MRILCFLVYDVNYSELHAGVKLFNIKLDKWLMEYQESLLYFSKYVYWHSGAGCSNKG